MEVTKKEKEVRNKAAKRVEIDLAIIKELMKAY